MFKVSIEQANVPMPTPPNWYAPQYLWEYYFDDLACWRALQADRLMYGIEENKTNVMPK